MGKMFLSGLLYLLAFYLLSLIFNDIQGDAAGYFLMALVLTLANLVIRPVLLCLALPFNMFTFGLASVFVNILTLLIADGIIGTYHINGFFMLALAAVIVMAFDMLIRSVWDKKKKHA